MSDAHGETPFRAHVVPVRTDQPLPNQVGDTPMDDDWSEQDLDAVYRQTLEAVDAATEDVSWTLDHAEEGGERKSAAELDPPGTPDESADADEVWRADPAETMRISARQVVEAVMFVGGGPVTGKQIAELLGGESTHERVDDIIESLNTLYVNQSRPYVIRLVEGGYQLSLRSEFDRVRHLVYGLGPREVKLSQDALELLAVVAYQQPISKPAIDELGKSNAPTVLRQLLRRELISLERDDDDSKTVAYRTTSRFLELFGLNSLDDLPRVEDLALR